MKYCARLLLPALILLSSTASASVRWEVVSSGQGSLTLKVSVEGAVLSELTEGLSSVRVPGAHATGEPGMPALPADARWIGLPPSGDPVLRIVSSTIEELGSGRLIPVGVPQLAPPDSDGPRLIERREFAEGYDSFRLGENEMAVLGRPVRQRRHRMAAIAIRPVLYDAASGRLRVVRELEISVSWPAPVGGVESPAQSDATILRSVLNPDQTREWSGWSPRQQEIREAAQSRGFAQREATAPGIGVLDPGALAADGIRLRVNHSGIVRVSVSDLMASGGLPETVPRSWLRVVQMRASEPGSPEYPLPLVVDVPAHFFGTPDESATLTASDEVYFHSLRVEDDPDTLTTGSMRALPALPWGESSETDFIPPRYAGDHFNRDNIYWIYLMQPPVDGWSRMEPVTYFPSGGSPATSYQRREHFEGQQGYRADPHDSWVERYAWNRRDEVDVVRTIRLVNPVEGADVIVKWAAGGHISGSDLPVDFSVRQGGLEVPLLSRLLNQTGLMTDWTTTVTASPFVSGTLDFRMRRLFQGGDVWVNSFVDHVELEYPAEFRASSDALGFTTGVQLATADVEVEGFSRDDLLCFDVSDPRHPRWVDLTAANVEDRSAGGPANFALSLNVSQPAGEKTFIASPRVRYPRIGRAAIERDPVADLFEVVDDLQVVAIGPEEFRAQTDRWITWREQTYIDAGWNFDFVDVQQIYDQFSGGLQSPWAIKQFVEWAWTNWGAVALVLVGDANEDVLDAGGRAGPNLVPPSLHLQSFTGSRELLASDKWYGLFGYVPQGSNQYPRGLDVTSDLVVGRFPVGNESDLATLVDKIMAYEQSDPDAEWRRRTLWVADDAYSSDLISAGSGCYRYQAGELEFLTSQQSSAAVVEGALDQTISAVVQNADDFTVDCRQGDVTCESLSGVRFCFDANHRTDFLDRWSQGWLWLSYQGHANYNVLGHENLILASALSQLRNDGRPWVFFGMGCHVSDFLRAEEGAEGASLGELVLRLPRAGAIATYGSSGFEFLSPNATFMEVLGETMFDRLVPDSPVFGSAMRNQWILGDVMARGELETLALRSSVLIYKGDEMVSQYNLLGDPLLRMDAGAPRMDVTRAGLPIAEGAEIDADSGLPFAAIDLALVDESGLDRLEITDSEGRDYSAVVPGFGGPDPRQQAIAVELPVFPQSYSVEVATFDSARPEIRRTVLGLNVSLPLDFRVDGEPVTPGSTIEFEVGVGRAMEVDFTSPVDLVEADIAIEFADVDVFGTTITGSGRDWSVTFDASARSGTPPGVLNLLLQGIPTELLGSGVDPGTVPPSVVRHAIFPNPVANSGHVVLLVQGTVDRARMSVYDLAGNEVSSSELAIGSSEPDPESGTRIAIEFEARDRRGDELANGTYFYRISVEGPTGSARSDMGRLLVMR